jgi:hypothetical protein
MRLSPAITLRRLNSTRRSSTLVKGAYVERYCRILPEYVPWTITRWDILVRFPWDRAHVGAIKDSRNSKDSAMEKIRYFRDRGIKVTNHLGNIGREMSLLLKDVGEKRFNVRRAKDAGESDGVGVEGPDRL